MASNKELRTVTVRNVRMSHVRYLRPLAVEDGCNDRSVGALMRWAVAKQVALERDKRKRRRGAPVPRAEGKR